MILLKNAPRGLLLLSLTALAYGTILGGAFQYDDYRVIVFEPAVHSLGGWAAGLSGLRPLLKLTYALNWSLDQAPAGFLLCNLALHLLNTWLVHRLLLAVGKRCGMDPDRVAAAAFLAALVFGLHPLQSEAVAYVSGRSSALSASLTLASGLAYLHGRDSSRPVWSAVLSPGLFVLALLVKETALVLPLALTLLEGCRADDRQRRLAGPWVHWLLAVGCAAMLALHPGYRSFLAMSFRIRGMEAQLKGALVGLGYLFAKLAWPLGLNIDPPLTVPAGWTFFLLGVALGLMALVGIGVLALRRQPWLAFGLLWGLIFLLPTQGPVPRLDLANERHAYLALAGFAFALSGLLCGLPRRGLLLVGCGLVLGLGLATMKRVRDYRNEVTLWQASLRVAPENARAWNNLGVALHGKGQRKEARDAFQEALRLRPGYRLAADNLRSVD